MLSNSHFIAEAVGDTVHVMLTIVDSLPAAESVRVHIMPSHHPPSTASPPSSPTFAGSTSDNVQLAVSSKTAAPKDSHQQPAQDTAEEATAAVLNATGQDDQSLSGTSSRNNKPVPPSSESSLPQQPEIASTSKTAGDSTDWGVQSGLASMVSAGRLSRSLQLPLPWPLPSWRPSPPAPSPTLQGLSRGFDLPHQHDSPQVAEPSERFTAAPADAAEANSASLKPQADGSAVMHRPDQASKTPQGSDSAQSCESAQAAQAAQASKSLGLPETAQQLMSAQQLHSTDPEPDSSNQSVQSGLLAAADVSPSVFLGPGVAHDASAPVLSQRLPEPIPHEHSEHKAGQSGEEAEQGSPDLERAVAGMKPEQRALWAKGLQLSRLVHQVIPSHRAHSLANRWFLAVLFLWHSVHTVCNTAITCRSAGFLSSC